MHTNIQKHILGVDIKALAPGNFTYIHTFINTCIQTYIHILGVVIKAVAPGGPAARSGQVREGDFILEV
jgi:hypothetical protein